MSESPVFLDSRSSLAPAFSPPQIGVERTPPANRDELYFANPMRAPERVRMRLALAGATRLELVSLTGRSGGLLIDAPLRAGWHSITLPEGVLPGTYFVRLETESGRTTAMMVVTR